MKNLYVLLFCLLFSVATLVAQDEREIRTINKGTLLGVGRTYLFDTYLSPLTYKGENIGVFIERFQRIQYLHDKLYMQQQFILHTAFTRNPGHTSSEYYCTLQYNLNGFYPLMLGERFRLLAGGGVGALLGGIYNVRNSNNPGSLKTALNMDISTMAFYNIKQLTFRWQFSSPFCGIFFAPDYDESYYEIFSQEHSRGTIVFGSLHNQRALQNCFTVDVPVKGLMVRTGYLCNYCHTTVHHISTKILTHQFLIGLAYENLPLWKSKKSRMFKSGYY